MILLGGIIPIVGPIVGLVFNVMVILAVAKNFGKSSGFAVGMILLPFVFFPMLAFSDAQYIGEDAPESEDLLDN